MSPIDDRSAIRPRLSASESHSHGGQHELRQEQNQQKPLEPDITLVAFDGLFQLLLQVTFKWFDVQAFSPQEWCIPIGWNWLAIPCSASRVLDKQLQSLLDVALPGWNASTADVFATKSAICYLFCSNDYFYLPESIALIM